MTRNICEAEARRQTPARRGDRGAQWPGSRVISAQKANTANAFSLDASSRSGSPASTSCAAHNIAYRVRHALNLDHLAAAEGAAAVPGPASLFANDATHPDNIIFDTSATGSASGFGHPTCLNAAGSDALPAVQP